METKLSKQLDITELKAQYDDACRRVLAEKHVLAWILKYTLEEYKDCPIDDIADKYIEGTPDINNRRVDSEESTSEIQGISTDDKSPNEGTIFYDIKFNAIVPPSTQPDESEGNVNSIIVNIESQKDFHPGYPLLKRAAYYCGRMISAQNGTIFVNQHYEKLRKVCSIWICLQAPKYLQNTVTQYSMREHNLIGEVKNPKSHYDLITVVMVCLGSPSRAENDMLKMLNTLMSNELKADEKRKVLRDDFQIKMTYKDREELRRMCNLSEGVYENGYNNGYGNGFGRGYDNGFGRGFDNGFDNASIQTLVAYIRNKHVSMEEAFEDLSVPENKRPAYADILKHKLNGE